jgi:myo-inositol-1-phosphate synthase
MSSIRVAIAGVGNCASALLQGLTYYSPRNTRNRVGLLRRSIAGLSPASIRPVAAFDVDRRKVGKSLAEAAAASPNCTLRFCAMPRADDVIVEMGPLLDGVAPHMAEAEAECGFFPAGLPAVDVAASLRRARVEVLVCYLPVGSEKAVRYYADACIRAGVAFVNCVPVFISSDPAWEKRFRLAGLPLIGDDVKSQLGATIVHRSLATLCSDRGVVVDRTFQLNVGGNTDFRNMLDRRRLASKKASKTEAVQACLQDRLDAHAIHIGPADFVPWLDDQKVCFIRIEGRGFGGAPVELDLRLVVHDSPNSAGVVIDLIRYARLARLVGAVGAIQPVCALYMKKPPVQMREEAARAALRRFEGRLKAVAARPPASAKRSAVRSGSGGGTR